MASNDRGTYEDRKESRGNGALSIVIVLGIAGAIYGFSPGARHWYKHGRLP
jgi:hypothetical protein